MNITHKIFLVIFCISSIAAYGQSEKGFSKAQMKKMEKEFAAMQQQLKPQETNDFLPYFKPELIDTFFTYIKQNNYDELYNNSNELLTNLLSKDDFEKYFKTVKHFYGQIKKYEKETYSIANQWMSANKTATATYKTEFDNANGIISLTFSVVNSDTIQLQAFQITIDDYTQIAEFDEISKQTLDFLKSKEYQKLYNATSERFQIYTPIGKYEEFIKQLKDVDFSNYKQFRNQISFLDSKPTLIIMYDIHEGQGFLQLIFTEIDDKFQLEGINYESNTTGE